MRRTSEDIERAIDLAAAHAWERHNAEGMYTKLGIRSLQQMRDHIAGTVSNEQSMCFVATDDREVFYDRITNTRVI